MRFRLGRKNEKRGGTPPPPPTPQTDLHRVLVEVESLAAATDEDIRQNFDSVRSTWGAREVLSLSAEGLRQQVAKVLANDAREGFTDVMVSREQDSTQPHVQFNTISSRSGTGRFYRVMRGKDGRHALYGHGALYRDLHRAGPDRDATSPTFLNIDMSPVRFLVVAAPAEATKILRVFLKKGLPPASLFEMDFGVGDLKCIGLPGSVGPGKRPTITISESHAPVDAAGPGARECTSCGIRWKSVYAELMDSGELGKLSAQGDVSVSASQEQTLGLTCTGCRRSRCLKHLGQPLPTGSLTEGGVTCPSCAKSLYHA